MVDTHSVGFVIKNIFIFTFMNAQRQRKKIVWNKIKESSF